MLIRYQNTVKPEIFTTILFSLLSRITKIREIKKSEKYLTVKFGVCRAIMGVIKKVELKPTCLSVDLPQCQICKHVLQLRIHTCVHPYSYLVNFTCIL